jgi:hypothetical protein
MTSRLQILDYCWKCLQEGNPYFRTHNYIYCTERTLLPGSNEDFVIENYNDFTNIDFVDINPLSRGGADSVTLNHSSNINNMHLYFSDDDSDDDSDNDNDNDYFEETDKEIDINHLMFGFKLTKTVLDICAICLEENIKPDDTTTLDCNHTFCNPCLSRIILKCNLVCALCRNPINLKNI